MYVSASSGEHEKREKSDREEIMHKMGRKLYHGERNNFPAGLLNGRHGSEDEGEKKKGLSGGKDEVISGGEETGKEGRFGAESGSEKMEHPIDCV